jgi:TetR/AcrR family transcriptional repressor of lmrAB and yxaGH operons
VPRPDLHRAALIAAAARLLRRQGYAATGLSDILVAAGAPNGSLYHHFPGGKEELAIAAVSASAAAVQGALVVAVEEEPDVGAALERWIGGLIAGLEAEPRDGCPVAPVALEAAVVSEPLRRVSAAAFAAWVAVIAEALAAHRDRTVALRQARVALSAVEGALLLDRTARSTEHLAALCDDIGALVRLDPHQP